MRASVVLFRDATRTVACVETKERQPEYDALAAEAVRRHGEISKAKRSKSTALVCSWFA
jgi:hypothetical protein